MALFVVPEIGPWHLYRINGSQWTALTSGPWQVRDVIGLDEKRGLVWFTGNRETPLEQHIYSAPLSGKSGNGGEAKLLTEPGWWNAGVMDGAAGRIIVSRSSPDQPVQLYLADREGKRLRWLSENAIDGPSPAPIAAAIFRHYPARTAATFIISCHAPLEAGKQFCVHDPL
jgi:dipeptidyl-peptidase-4